MSTSKQNRKYSMTFNQKTLTQQHSKDAADINKIMARYIKTGVLDHVTKYQLQYSENTETDYHESMNIVIKANDMFMDLPSPVRKQFDNDPAAFLAFVSDPENIEKLPSMGLTNTPMSPPGDETKNPPLENRVEDAPKDAASVKKDK